MTQNRFRENANYLLGYELAIAKRKKPNLFEALQPGLLSFDFGEGRV